MGIFYARNWLSDRRKSRFSDGLRGGGTYSVQIGIVNVNYRAQEEKGAGLQMK